MIGKLTNEVLITLFETMVKIRNFELTVEKNFQLGYIYGSAHLATGQEAIATGAIKALEDTDIITITHRGHGHCIAKGSEMNLMMAELFGKATGYCKGKGGSMHMADIKNGNLGSSGVIGASTAIATGTALAIKKMKTDQIVICFFGDGTVNQGIWHESVNIASICHLPIIYLCENNQYGMGMPTKKATNLEKISDRARGYNIKGITIDGNDVLKVFATVRQLAKEVRNGKGPILLECITYRIKGHSLRDAQRYRPENEAREWLYKFCPIEKFKKYLLKENICDSKKIAEIEKTVLYEIEEAVNFALESPFLDILKVTEDIYA